MRFPFRNSWSYAFWSSGCTVDACNDGVGGV